MIRNSGDDKIDLGIFIASGGLWSCDVLPAFDTFTLRARFTETYSMPATSDYDLADDFVATEIFWSNHTRFGSHGYNLAPETPTYLWLKLLTPTYSSIFGETNTIVSTVLARVHLP